MNKEQIEFMLEEIPKKKKIIVNKKGLSLFYENKELKGYCQNKDLLKYSLENVVNCYALLKNGDIKVMTIKDILIFENVYGY